MIARCRATWSWVLAQPTGRWLVLGGLVGLATGVVGSIFQITTDSLARLVLGRFAGVDPELVVQERTADAATVAATPWLLPLVMAAGGLAAGLVCHHLARAARGGGTGAAVAAFHEHRGRIPARLTWVKWCASVLTLGTGGSGGREGPISLVGAGLGSLLAERLQLTARDRRILLVAGIAGGIAAVFRAPLTAAIYAIEVLYAGPDLETAALIPCFIAAATGYVSGTMGTDLLLPLIGSAPSAASTLFQPIGLSFHPADWLQLIGYTAVATISVLAAWIFSSLLRLVRHACERASERPWLAPAVGAGLAGATALAMVGLARWAVPGADIGTIALSTVGSGYGALHWLFAGGSDTLPPLVLALVLVTLALARALATALTVGSGGSGGLFGPSLVIGGCAGGAMGALIAHTGIAPPVPACVLMGMAAVLSATHRTPVAALLMVGEIAGTWLLLLPAMWVSGLAFLLGRSTSVVAGQVESQTHSAAHRSHHFADPLRTARVRDLLGQPHAWTTLRPEQPLGEIRHALQRAAHDALPVIGNDGAFLGVVERSEVTHLPDDAHLDQLVIALELASGAGVTLHPDEGLDHALSRLHAHQVQEMAVVDADGRFLGMVGLAQLASAYRTSVDRIEQDRASEESLASEMAARPRGATTEHRDRAHTLAD